MVPQASSDATVSDAAASDGPSADAAMSHTCAAPTTPLEIGVENVVPTVAGRHPWCVDPVGPTFDAQFSYTLPPGMYGSLAMQEVYSGPYTEFSCITVVAQPDCVVPICPANRQFNCGIAVFSPIGHENHTAAPQQIYVYASNNGTIPRRVSLKVDLWPLPSTLCATPIALVVGEPAQRTDFSNGAIGREACAAGPSLYYSVTVPPRSTGRIAINNSAGESQARLLDRCSDGPNCTLRAQQAPSVLLAQNIGDSERTFIVHVSEIWGSTATIAHLDNVPLAERCAIARSVAVGESLTDDTRRATNAASCASADGAALFYSVSIPARSRAHFSVRRSGADNVRVRVMTACDGATCAAATETVDASATPFVIDNPSDTPVQRILAASATGAPTEFSLAYLRTNELPTNTSCATVMALFPGQSVLVDTSLGGGAPVGCETSEGSARYYSAVLSPRQRATVTLTQIGGAAMRLRTYRDCAMGVCDGSVTTTPTTPATLEVRFEGEVMGGQLLSIGAVGGPASTGVAQLTVGPAMPL